MCISESQNQDQAFGSIFYIYIHLRPSELSNYLTEEVRAGCVDGNCILAFMCISGSQNRDQTFGPIFLIYIITCVHSC